jgi:prevent-host-death family protein
MHFKKALLAQLEASGKNEHEITVTDLAMSVSKLINIVNDKKKRLVIVNRNERVAVIAPYLETKGENPDGE